MLIALKLMIVGLVLAAGTSIATIEPSRDPELDTQAPSEADPPALSAAAPAHPCGEAYRERQEWVTRMMGRRAAEQTAEMNPWTASCGRPIEIAGRIVQLPPDAYVNGLMTNAQVIPGQPGYEMPSYQIRRGESWIVIGLRTGRINWEVIAPGEEGAFDSLKAALLVPSGPVPPTPHPDRVVLAPMLRPTATPRAYNAGPPPGWYNVGPPPGGGPGRSFGNVTSPGIVATPPGLLLSPPPANVPPPVFPTFQLPPQRPGETAREYWARTSGATSTPWSYQEQTQGQVVTIGGRNVQFPPDAYVFAGVGLATCMQPTSPECLNLPPLPWIIVRRGDASITISVQTGGVVSKNTPAGQERAFDFLAEAIAPDESPMESAPLLQPPGSAPE